MSVSTALVCIKKREDRSTECNMECQDLLNTVTSSSPSTLDSGKYLHVIEGDILDYLDDPAYRAAFL